MTQNLKTSALIVVLSGMCAGAQTAGTDDKTSPSPAANTSDASPGMKVYIDPETGEFLEQPPKGAQPMVTPSAVLPEPEQVESPVPGGGVKVDVKHFRTPLQVRMGSDGKPVLRHGDLPSAPPK